MSSLDAASSALEAANGAEVERESGATQNRVKSKRTERARSKTVSDREEAQLEGVKMPKKSRRKEGESIKRTKSGKSSSSNSGAQMLEDHEFLGSTSETRAESDDKTTKQKHRMRSKSSNASSSTDATQVHPEPIVVSPNESTMTHTTKESGETSMGDAKSNTNLQTSFAPPPPTNLPPPPVFHIATPTSPTISARHGAHAKANGASPNRLRPGSNVTSPARSRPIDSSNSYSLQSSGLMTEDLDGTNSMEYSISSSTIGLDPQASSPIPILSGTQSTAWKEQMEKDLFDMEIRIRKKQEEENSLDASIEAKKKILHDLDMQVERKQSELSQLRNSAIGQMAVNNDLPPPTLSTPGSRALGPTTSAVWKSLGPVVSSSSSSIPSTQRTTKIKSSPTGAPVARSTPPKSTANGTTSSRVKVSSTDDSIAGAGTKKSSSSSKSSSNLASKSISSSSTASTTKTSSPTTRPVKSTASGTTAKPSTLRDTSTTTKTASETTSSDSIGSAKATSASILRANAIKREQSTKEKVSKTNSKTTSSKTASADAVTKTRMKGSKSAAVGLVAKNAKVTVSKTETKSVPPPSHLPPPPPELIPPPMGDTVPQSSQ